jgi:hypothetical protein
MKEGCCKALCVKTDMSNVVLFRECYQYCSRGCSVSIQGRRIAASQPRCR